MDEHIRTWWPIVAALVIFPLGLALRWAAGAWVRTLSRVEAVAAVADALRTCGLLEAQSHKTVSDKLARLAEGHREILAEVRDVNTRLAVVEASLNGTIVRSQWDGQTERRAPRGG